MIDTSSSRAKNNSTLAHDSMPSAAVFKVWLNLYPEWAPPHIDYNFDALLDVYRHTLSNHPRRKALTLFGHSTSYTELGAKVRNVAAGLRASDVREGDCVALLAPNCL